SCKKNPSKRSGPHFLTVLSVLVMVLPWGAADEMTGSSGFLTPCPSHFCAEMNSGTAFRVLICFLAGCPEVSSLTPQPPGYLLSRLRREEETRYYYCTPTR